MQYYNLPLFVNCFKNDFPQHRSLSEKKPGPPRYFGRTPAAAR
jgi:hypothetical protein